MTIRTIAAARAHRVTRPSSGSRPSSKSGVRRVDLDARFLALEGSGRGRHGPPTRSSSCVLAGAASMVVGGVAASLPGKEAPAVPSLSSAVGCLASKAEDMSSILPLLVRQTCPRGHPVHDRASNGWDFCNGCGHRPGSWSGGEDRVPYVCCHLCDFALCGDCSGLAAAITPEVPSHEQAALTLLLRLADEARSDQTRLLPSGRIPLSHFAPEATDSNVQHKALLAFVSGPVVRQIVSQGELSVCGAAATAGVLNACTEQVAVHKLRLQLTWHQVLFGHFRDKLRLKVKDAAGAPASWKVGKCHIRQVIESFPNMRTCDLVTQEEAQAARRAEAWKALVSVLQRPHTAVFFHTRGRQFGHYTLVAGAVGVAPAGSVTPMPGSSITLEYSEAHSAIFTNQVKQRPLQRMSFASVCDEIVKSEGFCRMFSVEYQAR